MANCSRDLLEHFSNAVQQFRTLCTEKAKNGTPSAKGQPVSWEPLAQEYPLATRMSKRCSGQSGFPCTTVAFHWQQPMAWQLSADITVAAIPGWFANVCTATESYGKLMKKTSSQSITYFWKDLKVQHTKQACPVHQSEHWEETRTWRNKSKHLVTMLPTKNRNASPISASPKNKQQRKITISMTFRGQKEKQNSFQEYSTRWNGFRLLLAHFNVELCSEYGAWPPFFAARCTPWHKAPTFLIANWLFGTLTFENIQDSWILLQFCSVLSSVAAWPTAPGMPCRCQAQRKWV